MRLVAQKAVSSYGRVMTIDYAGIIRDYGYLAILVGTFLEGETILILAGVAASIGNLDLPLVILTAFLGSSAGDQLYYFIGKWKGQALLDYFPRWQNASARVLKHVKRHKNIVILAFRFFYGLRNVTPFVLGIAKIETLRFVVLNLIGAAIWAVSFATIGYVLGEAHARFLGKSSSYVLLLVLFVFFFVFWIFRKYNTKQTLP